VVYALSTGNIVDDIEWPQLHSFQVTVVFESKYVKTTHLRTKLLQNITRETQEAYRMAPSSVTLTDP